MLQTKRRRLDLAPAAPPEPGPTPRNAPTSGAPRRPLSQSLRPVSNAISDRERPAPFLKSSQTALNGNDSIHVGLSHCPIGLQCTIAGHGQQTLRLPGGLHRVRLGLRMEPLKVPLMASEAEGSLSRDVPIVRTTELDAENAKTIYTRSRRMQGTGCGGQDLNPSHVFLSR